MNVLNKKNTKGFTLLKGSGCVLSAAFVLSCNFPERPAYGDVTVSSLHAGGEAYFYCFTGYQLLGPPTLTCLNATTPYWNGKEPRCLGEKETHQHNVTYNNAKAFFFQNYF